MGYEVTKRLVEVCFSPAVFDSFFDPEAIVVITDILRSSTAICTALAYGVDNIVPVPNLEEAAKYKQKGFIVAAERDGQVLDFADFGNSPWYFMEESLQGKTIVYSTTNGTNAVRMAGEAHQAIIASHLNLTATCEYLKNQQRKVVILCAGWKRRFSLEDAVHAGALVECLMEDERYYTDCDSAKASLDLWEKAKPDLYGYILKTAQKKRLQRFGLDDVMEYAHIQDQTHVLPVFDPENNRIVHMFEFD